MTQSMYRYFLPTLFFFSCAVLKGQVGISYRINRTDLDHFNVRVPNTVSSVAINYWLRMRDVRIELLPEISYSFVTGSNSQYEFSRRRIGAGAYLLTYPLDFFGDCDCPTFSKENSWFKKGWFVGLFTSGGRNSLGVKDLIVPTPNNNEHHAYVSVGVTTGLDMGITDLITFTLFGQLNQLYYPGHSPFTDGDIEKQIGVRFGLRLDYQE